MFARDGTQRLALEVRELRLKLEHALCRVIPALLEGASDQSVVGIHGLVAPFRQISIIASALRQRRDRQWHRRATSIL